MELDKFISESLKAIIKGVADSQDFAKQNGARINPEIDGARDKFTSVNYQREDGDKIVSTIDFDIAVTTSNEQAASGQGGINVLSVKIGGSLSDKDVHETASRIKFAINVVLPTVKP